MKSSATVAMKLLKWLYKVIVVLALQPYDLAGKVNFGHLFFAVHDSEFHYQLAFSILLSFLKENKYAYEFILSVCLTSPSMFEQTGRFL
jgi:hypothetical protein